MFSWGSSTCKHKMARANFCLFAATETKNRSLFLDRQMINSKGQWLFQLTCPSAHLWCHSCPYLRSVRWPSLWAKGKWHLQLIMTVILCEEDDVVRAVLYMLLCQQWLLTDGPVTPEWAAADRWPRHPRVGGCWPLVVSCGEGVRCQATYIATGW